MLDHWDFAIRNVRIDRNLRRRRNDNGNRDAGDDGDVGNVDVVWNISDIGNYDNLRDDGHVGIVGNVRFRLEQHCFIVSANVAYNAGRRCSNRNSVGIYRDRQSWGQLRSSGTNGECLANCGCGRAGTSDAPHCLSAHCFTYIDKPFPVPDQRDVEHHERLLK